MTIFINNSNSLAFLDKQQWNDDLMEIESSPDVVLLSSHECQDEENNFQKEQPLITKLIDLGCKYFVCAGKNSEQLHDFIDDVILGIPLSSNHADKKEIMTTWHDNDTNEEVAYFFLHLTNVSDSLLVAIFDENRVEDLSLKKAILKYLEVQISSDSRPFCSS